MYTNIKITTDLNTSVESQKQVAIKNNQEEKKDQEITEYIETPWHLIEAYFKPDYSERLVQHQIASYNHFIKMIHIWC